jgi:DNA-binding NtrC family response regulator
MHILIVDDEQAQRNILADILKDAGYKVDLAENGEKALQKFAAHQHAIVLTDLKMPGKDGLDVLKGVQASSPETQVIIMTAFGTIPGAVNAIKIGAYDYLTKPFKKNDLLQIVGRAGEKVKLLQENSRLKNEISNRYQYDSIIGQSPKMQHIFNMIERIANIDATVLISGLSGTGKELVAKAIHYNGNRKAAPFVAINCGAIPETLIESELFGHEKGAFTGAAKTYIGKFEQAQGGTIFLDEIGCMRMDLQIRLLRVLQEKKVERLGSNHSVELNVRVIAASNENLEMLIQDKLFRSDLYHRLNVFSIDLPSLQERPEDIPLLVRHFLEKYAGQYKREVPALSPEALTKMENYPFPGNVRELENIIEKTIILTDHNPILAEDLMLPESKSQKRSIKEISANGSLTDIEYDLICDALKKSKGSIKKAAQELGISYKTLQYRMKKFDMSKNDFR